MVITAGGYRWAVESRRRETPVDGADFVDLTFRRLDAEGEALELGWTPSRGPLAAEAARRLFELAGRRRWVDPRSGRRWSVEIVPEGSDEELAGPLAVVFVEGGSPAVQTVYPLPRPLGLATTPELQAMLDVALETATGGDGGGRPRRWSTARRREIT